MEHFFLHIVILIKQSNQFWKVVKVLKAYFQDRGPHSQKVVSVQPVCIWCAPPKIQFYKLCCFFKPTVLFPPGNCTVFLQCRMQYVYGTYLTRTEWIVFRVDNSKHANTAFKIYWKHTHTHTIHIYVYINFLFVVLFVVCFYVHFHFTFSVKYYVF